MRAPLRAMRLRCTPDYQARLCYDSRDKLQSTMTGIVDELKPICINSRYLGALGWVWPAGLVQTAKRQDHILMPSRHLLLLNLILVFGKELLVPFGSCLT